MNGDYYETFPTRVQTYNKFVPYTEIGCVTLMDSDREKEIGVGKLWPYDKMERTQCTISDRMAEQLDVGVGDIMYIKLDMY